MSSGNSKKKPIPFAQSFARAWKGIVHSLQTESHLRFHFFASLVVVGCGLIFRVKNTEWLFIIYAIGSVVIAELFNTALERAVDLSHPEYHPLAGLAKDIASGAVLIAAIQAVIIGIIIFGAYIF